MVKKSMLVLGLIAALAIGLAACGSSDDSTSPTASEASATSAEGEAGEAAEAGEDAEATPTTDTGSSGGEAVPVTAAADGSLAYDEKTLDAKAGAIDLKLDNPSSTEHNVCVRSESGDELGCSEDTSQGKVDLSVDLKSGTYEFYCSEPGHEEAGMKGTLTVK